MIPLIIYSNRTYTWSQNTLIEQSLLQQEFVLLEFGLVRIHCNNIYLHGNKIIFLAVKQCIRCILIVDCLNFCLLRCNSNSKAVTIAIEDSPQLFPPFCFWQWPIVMLSFGQFAVAKRLWIRSFVSDYTPCQKHLLHLTYSWW